MSNSGILCACEKEAAPYIANMYDISTSEFAMHTFYNGKIKDVDAVA